MSIVEKIKAELKVFEDKRNELVKELQKDFLIMFKPLFEKSEKIESIGWTQYTPYFADGEECIFSVHMDLDWGISINGERLEDTDEEEDFLSEEIGYPPQPNPNYLPEERTVVEEILQVLNSIPEEFYKDLFGDHCQVTLKRDGTIDVEEYEHE